MGGLFKFKKVIKEIAGISVDDPNEYVLVVKNSPFDFPSFIHYQRLWCVEEKPEIEADEENGIEGQRAVKKVPVTRIIRGFIKDDNFIIENTYISRQGSLEHCKDAFMLNLERCAMEGYHKDWNNYDANGVPIEPVYHGGNEDSSGSMLGNTLRQTAQKMAALPKVMNNIVKLNKKP